MKISISRNIHGLIKSWNESLNRFKLSHKDKNDNKNDNREKFFKRFLLLLIKINSYIEILLFVFCISTKIAFSVLIEKKYEKHLSIFSICLWRSCNVISCYQRFRWIENQTDKIDNQLCHWLKNLCIVPRAIIKC